MRILEKVLNSWKFESFCKGNIHVEAPKPCIHEFFSESIRGLSCKIFIKNIGKCGRGGIAVGRVLLLRFAILKVHNLYGSYLKQKKSIKYITHTQQLNQRILDISSKNMQNSNNCNFVKKSYRYLNLKKKFFKASTIDFQATLAFLGTTCISAYFHITSRCRTPLNTRKNECRQTAKRRRYDA